MSSRWRRRLKKPGKPVGTGRLRFDKLREAVRWKEEKSHEKKSTIIFVQSIQSLESCRRTEVCQCVAEDEEEERKNKRNEAEEESRMNRKIIRGRNEYTEKRRKN
ncbi:hypothetical protein RUM43_012845 [Polyplax serrata]|uniref:Uncharacterized protein n=1 Tax=Polyplax serrata TaxID=468196 RepID=A0AAN8S441_POLSC